MTERRRRRSAWEDAQLGIAEDNGEGRFRAVIRDGKTGKKLYESPESFETDVQASADGMLALIATAKRRGKYYHAGEGGPGSRREGKGCGPAWGAMLALVILVGWWMT